MTVFLSVSVHRASLEEIYRIHGRRPHSGSTKARSPLLKSKTRLCTPVVLANTGCSSFLCSLKISRLLLFLLTQVQDQRCYQRCDGSVRVCGALFFD
jgi:hypothetical protein